jgi:hypothetical protein
MSSSQPLTSYLYSMYIKNAIRTCITDVDVSHASLHLIGRYKDFQQQCYVFVTYVRQYFMLCATHVGHTAASGAARYVDPAGTC